MVPSNGRRLDVENPNEHASNGSNWCGNLFTSDASSLYPRPTDSPDSGSNSCPLGLKKNSRSPDSTCRQSVKWNALRQRTIGNHVNTPLTKAVHSKGKKVASAPAQR